MPPVLPPPAPPAMTCGALPRARPNEALFVGTCHSVSWRGSSPTSTSRKRVDSAEPSPLGVPEGCGAGASSMPASTKETGAANRLSVNDAQQSPSVGTLASSSASVVVAGLMCAGSCPAPAVHHRRPPRPSHARQGLLRSPLGAPAAVAPPSVAANRADAGTPPPPAHPPTAPTRARPEASRAEPEVVRPPRSRAEREDSGRKCCERRGLLPERDVAEGAACRGDCTVAATAAVADASDGRRGTRCVRGASGGR